MNKKNKKLSKSKNKSKSKFSSQKEDLICHS